MKANSASNKAMDSFPEWASLVENLASVASGPTQKAAENDLIKRKEAEEAVAAAEN